MSWLDLVPVSSSAHVCNDDLICDDCARVLARQGVKSDPVPDGGGEADFPLFCASRSRCESSVTVTAGRLIGCPLGNPLTSDGARDLQLTVRRMLVDPSSFRRRMGRLYRRIWGACLDAHEPPTQSSSPAPLPASARSHLARYRSQHRPLRVESQRYCDLDHLYLAARKESEIHLLRLAVNDDGNFDAPEIVAIPHQVGQGETAANLMACAASDAAWE
jgi:hypothetical protein